MENPGKQERELLADRLPGYLYCMHLYRIKENSWRARVATRLMRSDNMAIVFGDTIHIYGVSRQEFQENARWVKHEIKHIEQYRLHGYAGFLAKYLWESLRRGYYNNRFEIEAREAEDAKD